MHVEEAYLTYLGMPWGLRPRAGKFRSSFGRANPLHLHALPWVEYPLVIQNYFGEEGLSGEGLGVSWLVPNRWNKYIELTYEITNNDSSLFAGNEADDFVHLAHLKTFWDLSDASSLEAGASFAIAPNDKGHEGNLTLVEGVDLTYKWRPPAAGLYKSLLWQTELLMAQADLRGGQEQTWGAYTALDYQFARRWLAPPMVSPDRGDGFLISAATVSERRRPDAPAPLNPEPRTLNAHYRRDACATRPEAHAPLGAAAGAPPPGHAARPRRSLLADDAGGGRDRRARNIVRQPATEQLIQHHTERIDVAAHVELERIGPALLGAHVLERADQLAGLRSQRGQGDVGVGRAGHAEIDDLHAAAGVDQDVPRLQVAVDHAALMAVLNRLADLLEQPKCSMHDLRRSFCTNLSRAIPMHVVQELAGHSDIRTTRRFYVQVEPELMQRACRALETALDEAAETEDGSE